MRFVIDIKPRFDYGRQEHDLEVTEEGAIFHTDQLELTLHSVGSPGTSPRENGAEVERIGDDLRIRRTLKEGEGAGMVLESRAAARAGCRTASWSGCPTTPPSTGGAGSREPATGRWREAVSGRPSPSS